MPKNDLKPTRLKRQITPRNLGRKESLPKYAKKNADGVQNSILVFFRRFFENYKLVDKARSNKDELNSFGVLSSSSESQTFLFIAKLTLGRNFLYFQISFSGILETLGKARSKTEQV